MIIVRILRVYPGLFGWDNESEKKARNVTTEAEIKAKWPQTKKCWQPSVARRDREWIPLLNLQKEPALPTP